MECFIANFARNPGDRADAQNKGYAKGLVVVAKERNKARAGGGQSKDGGKGKHQEAHGGRIRGVCYQRICGGDHEGRVERQSQRAEKGQVASAAEENVDQKTRQEAAKGVSK